jgi:hypothetical protein
LLSNGAPLILGDDAGGHDRVIGELAPGGLDHELVRLLGGGERVGGAEHGGGHLPLELHRVDHDHVLGPGEPGALHRVAAHAAPPKITTVSPAWTPAACTEDPQPVGTPQPTRHSSSHGMSVKSSRSGTLRPV